MGRLALIFTAALLVAGCGGSSAVRDAKTGTQSGGAVTTTPGVTTIATTPTSATSPSRPTVTAPPPTTTATTRATTTTGGPPSNSGGVSSSAPNIGCPAGDTQSGLACLYHGGDPAGNPSGKVNPTHCPSGTSAEDGGCMPDPASQATAAKTTTTP